MMILMNVGGRRMKIRGAVCVFLVLLLGMGGVGRANVREGGGCAVADTSVVAELPLPSVPPTLRTVPERAAYVLEHFWDAMDFKDTLRSRNRTFIEQNFVNFVSLFPHALQEDRARAVERLMKAAEADTFAYAFLAEMAEKYLYEPESPMACEDCFLLFLEEMVSTSVWDELAKVRPVYLLERVKKNRPGCRATDFTYLMPDEKRRTLYETPGKWLLLFFYDSDCDHCQEVMADLQEDVVLRRLADAGDLTVLLVDTGGNRSAWERTCPTLPAAWISALDAEGVWEQELYVWRSLPALYLLDASKTVLLKETSWQMITTFLTEM